MLGGSFNGKHGSATPEYSAGNIDIGTYLEKQVKKKEFPSIRKFFIKYLKACDLDYENIDNINKMETFYPNN